MNGCVPRNVGLELRLPEFRPGGWGGRVATAFMAMPKAAVHEDHGAMFWKNEIGPPVNLFGVKPESEAAGV